MNDNSKLSGEWIARAMTPRRSTVGADQKPVTPGAAYRAFMEDPHSSAATAARNRMIERQKERNGAK